MTIDRRTFMTLMGLSSLAPSLVGQAMASDQPPATGDASVKLGTAESFSLEGLIEKARLLSQQPYSPPQKVPEEWGQLSYDEYKGILSRHDTALWHEEDSEYQVQFFAPGFLYKETINLNIVEGDEARRVLFNRNMFTYADNVPDLPFDETIGLSGFRLHTYINEPHYAAEFVVFQGASYFRGLGRNHWYGNSARGLAIDTGEPWGEEFPDFTDFWLEKPAPDAQSIRVHALMNSKRITGCYSFDITPDDSTKMKISCHLFPRAELRHVGIAPLTSMFLFDETDHLRFDDFRPTEHDSDGLMILNGNGEYLWRQLANPVHLQISAFRDENPRGFGLMQRSRDFRDFQDLDFRYESRPSLWVTPKGEWGKGAVTLVEIPSIDSTNDNIAAYWRPDEPLMPGEQYSLAYDLDWCWEAPIKHPLSKVEGTIISKHRQGGRMVMVDFAAHEGLPDDLDEITLDNRSTPAGKIKSWSLRKNWHTGGIRLTFHFDPQTDRWSDLRAQLRHRETGKPLSEVWLYRWTV
ncbi:glucan biosynthesis protein [Kiloniella sp. b19]|uniref:glucan biosynthesis protein n=1 Tax=Kiloniella sp. GXU_MW_B19 TaxID=3141326 RepID=UPI0031DCAD1E